MIGLVSDYFDTISVAAINIIDGTLQLGDTIHIKGIKTDFETTVESMQINRLPVLIANAGDSIGLKVSHPVRKKDVVYKVLNN